MPFDEQAGFWSLWRHWTGGEPPVPAGTTVDAWMRWRDPPEADEEDPLHLIFVVTSGDSFRLSRLRQPLIRTVVVLRFRYWIPQIRETVKREERIEEFV